MSGLKEVVKHGWHPEKDGTTFKGQIKGLVGRKDDSSRRRADHVSQPLSSLRDPASFGPPPKHVNSGTPGTISPASPGLSHAQPPTPPRLASGVPAPASPQGGADVEKPEPRPYRVDTTGLSTAHLPPPPIRREGADGRSPPPSMQPVAKPPPSLPPRLPPRTGSGSPGAATTAAASPSPSSAANGLLNQGALNRLGAAGVSVPALGIGRGAAPKASSPPPPARSPASGSGQLSELQSRFARLGTSGGAPSPAPPTEGTSLAQKQAALQTASAFRKDPSSVSVSDARAAASTFNNFRQRHGDQVTAGVRQASSFSEKYGVAERVGTFTRGSEEQPPPTSRPPSLTAATSAFGKKKPAPPPPPKKPALSQRDDAPPPLPLATKHQF